MQDLDRENYALALFQSMQDAENPDLRTLWNHCNDQAIEASGRKIDPAATMDFQSLTPASTLDSQPLAPPPIALGTLPKATIGATVIPPVAAGVRLPSGRRARPNWRLGARLVVPSLKYRVNILSPKDER
jgi:hypothetical protein